MKNMKLYEPDDQMIELIRDNYNVLQSLSSFGISMGFGSKTVRQVCEAHHVDTFTFLCVVNLTINGYHSQSDVHHLNVPTLLRYLRASHRYYIDFQLPFLRKELVDALDETQQLSQLILKVYDEYSRFISHHMRFEEQSLFPYVEELINGNKSEKYNVETFSKHHEQTEDKLKELKSIIIKYLPDDPLRNNMLTAALFDLYNLEELLELHASVEEKIFIPAISLLEERLTTQEMESPLKTLTSQVPDTTEQLSDREKEVVIGVVQGLTNKEIADKLFIAPNTVITHRRNIAKKLQIHSIAGLTIYAIVNKLVTL